MLQEGRQLYRAIHTILTTPYINNDVQISLDSVALADDEGAEIESLVDLDHQNEEDVEAENHNSNLIKQNSPYTLYFSNVTEQEDSSDRSTVTAASEQENEFYSAASFTVIQKYMHLFPLWSAAGKHQHAPNEAECQSNAAVESHFKNVKQGSLGGRKRLRPRNFMCKTLEYVNGKLNELLLNQDPKDKRLRVRRQKRPGVELQDKREVWKKRTKTANYKDPVVAKKLLKPVKLKQARNKKVGSVKHYY